MKHLPIQRSFVYIALATVLQGLFFSGCKKGVTVPPPDTQVLGSAVFANGTIATSAVIGIYATMQSSITQTFNGPMSIFHGLAADELVASSSSTAAAQAFYVNGLTSQLTEVGQSWSSLYNYIYSANVIIEGLKSAPGVTLTDNNQLTGEAKFIRGLSYFYLVNLYGDVPLITSSYIPDAQVQPRSTKETVYKQVIADLIDAQNLLSTSYVTTTAYPSARVRPNKFAAAALLARVYLYTNDFVNAELQASNVIASSTYSIETLDNAFLNTSKEAIWQLMPVASGNTAEGQQFIPSSSTVVPTYPLSTYLLAAFESNDQRRNRWVGSNVIGITTYYFPYKYKLRTGGTPYGEYNMVLRLSEQYLIRAEARAQQNKLSEAASDLNVIRARASLPNYVVTTQAALLTTIAHENQIEFFAEWGHRWLDLKRTGKADAVLGAEKTGWKSTAALWPVPYGQIQLNQALTQNPGY